MDDLLYFNGINATTGEYLLSPRSITDIAKLAESEPLSKSNPSPNLYALLERHTRETEPGFMPMVGIDAKELAQTGWGIIFANNDPNRAAIQEALIPLLNHRKEQAGDLCRIYTYYGGETAGEFLKREGKTQGTGAANLHDWVDPEKVSYYLLIVGDPAAIPYEFQYQLDVQYAVGRIYFSTLQGSIDLQAFADYARSVVAAETQPISLTPTAHFFGVSNEDDPATQLSAEHLIKPLYEQVSQYQQKKQLAWNSQITPSEAATVAQLNQLLGGSAETPALLFTASHGAAFDKGDPRQLAHQGALICQDWVGPEAGNHHPIPESAYFSADKIGNDARLLGLIAFHFACFGAGTPQHDEFGDRGQFPPLADHPFLAQLPQRLLSHPKGGALAVVGHVERAWGCSFTWQGDKGHITPFSGAIQQLMKGYPIGYALEPFNSRYAALSSGLTEILHQSRRGIPIDQRSLAYQWTANNDARGYAIIGDPAVRVMVKPEVTPQTERPTIEQIILPTSTSLASPPPPLPTITQPEHNPESFAPWNRTNSLEEKPESFGSLQQMSGKLQQLVSDLSTKLRQAVDEFATLEVVTYTSEDMARLNSVGSNALSQTDGIRLRAMTRIGFDGDTVVIVPADEDGEVDEALWKIHLDTVQQAQTHRAEMFKAMASVTTDLLKALKTL